MHDRFHYVFEIVVLSRPIWQAPALFASPSKCLARTLHASWDMHTLCLLLFFAFCGFAVEMISLYKVSSLPSEQAVLRDSMPP